MKTLLGKKIERFQFYKMDVSIPKKRRLVTKGYIWLSGNLKIRIDGSRFIIIEDLRQNGFISKTSITYRKIKRMIARWFSYHRQKLRDYDVTDYWKASIDISLNKFKIQRLDQFQKQFI